ncbi:hypothetical protein B0H17DRAFT_200958 [Mycena rosella]|uniref:Uncharacterized protein n=1 Tax=Mycena rosella TaxID=1033263 RepID=A0AAD7DX54_MYCRO|nr:hypothetical protein B0H17DRAFT_200958 [Mycena rosella]
MHSHGTSEDYSSRASPQKHQRRRTMSAVSIPAAGGESKIALTASCAPRGTAQEVALGAFTRTGCAGTSLRCLALGPLALSTQSYAGFTDPATRRPMPGDSPPASPACSFDSVPAFSPTFSQNRDEKGKGRARDPQIHSVLSMLERNSRMGTGNVLCAACGAQGTNFPCCKKCAQMWCSRECRLSPAHRCNSASGPRRGGKTT